MSIKYQASSLNVIFFESITDKTETFNFLIHKAIYKRKIESFSLIYAFCYGKNRKIDFFLCKLCERAHLFHCYLIIGAQLFNFVFFSLLYNVIMCIMS